MKKSLWVIIGLAFIFRMLFLGSRQLAIDELLQAIIMRASSVPEYLLRLRHAIFIASPLDMLMQKSITFILGDSAWALRLHAVVFGTLAIWLFARIAKMLFNDRVALYCTVLFAVFPLQYHYSQEGRPYSLLVLLTLVSYDLLLRIERREEVRKLDWLQLGVVLTALLYTSILGLAILAAQFVGLILVRISRPTGPETEHESGGAEWGNLVIYAAIACIAFAAFIPWLRHGWIRTGGSGIFYPGFLLRLFKELGDNSYAMTGLILAGVVAGFRAMRRHKTHSSLVWLVSWFSVATLAGLALKVLMRYPFGIADILAATPPLALMAGYGLSHVGERLTILAELPYQLSAPAFVYAALMVLGSVWIAQAHWKREPVDWAGTAALLQGTVRDGDTLAMPKISHLIEYHAPNLGAFRSAEIDPGPGSLSTGVSQRRVVVCYNNMQPDPCSGFRQKAQADTMWRKLELRGFTVFIRQNQAQAIPGSKPGP